MVISIIFAALLHGFASNLELIFSVTVSLVIQFLKTNFQERELPHLFVITAYYVKYLDSYYYLKDEKVLLRRCAIGYFDTI